MQLDSFIIFYPWIDLDGIGWKWMENHPRKPCTSGVYYMALTGTISQPAAAKTWRVSLKTRRFSET
jgi:hypothetical protein